MRTKFIINKSADYLVNREITKIPPFSDVAISEQSVGGKVSRFISIGDLNLAFNCIHSGGAGV